LQSLFRLNSAEAWRLGQRRRSQFLAALLKRKREDTAADAPDRVGDFDRSLPAKDRRRGEIAAE